MRRLSIELLLATARGNYVLFPDCRGSSFTLLPVHGASADSQDRAPVNGIQIIARQTSTTEGSSDAK